jgi:hypothetical protein
MENAMMGKPGLPPEFWRGAMIAGAISVGIRALIIWSFI